MNSKPEVVASRFTEFSVQQSAAGCALNVHSIETLKTVFVKHAPLRYKPLIALLRSAIRHRAMIVADGEEWRRTREAIDPAFHASVVSRQIEPIIRRVADEAFCRLAGHQSESELAPAVIEVDVEPLMRVVTLSVLCHVLFGQTLEAEEAERVEKMLASAMQTVSHGFSARINSGLEAALRRLSLAQHQPFLFPKTQRKAIKDLLRWIGGKIDHAEQSTIRPPLLESLKARYAGRHPAQLKRCLAAEYAMLCIAGIETTASALTFAIAEIANNPAIRDEVVREARRQPDCPRVAQAPAAQFPYLHCVVRETLRRHTIVPTLLRETETAYQLSGRCPRDGSTEDVRIRRGSILRYLPIQGHMRRNIWPDAHRFDPARFAQTLTLEQTRNYIPFGFGPQRCPGHAMATSEAILILRRFFEKFDVETRKITSGIPVVRNALFTNRPVGVTVRARIAPGD